MFAAIMAGTAAGIVHVLGGADHLAAITPLAVAGRRRAWQAGLRWGLGHTAGVAVVAGGALLLREALPLERLSGASERLVGLVLMAIGLSALRSAVRMRVHSHEHEHDGVRHTHVHVHREGADHPGGHAHVHTHAAFGVGTLHGVAGSSHVVGVLPALVLPAPGMALAYLAGYGLGSIATMSAVAFGIGRLSARLGRRTGPVYRRVLSACGSVAIVVGLFWVAR